MLVFKLLIIYLQAENYVIVINKKVIVCLLFNS